MNDTLEALPSARERVRTALRRPDVAIPAAATSVLFISLYGIAMMRYYSLETGYDLAYFRQAAWLIAHGRPAFITSRGLYLLGDHASPIFYPIGWVTRLLPDVPTLLGIQAAALAAGAVPLYLICRRLANLGPWPSAAVVVAYGFYPAMHNVNVADYHPETIAVPFFLWAVLFGLTRRWWLFAACVAVPLLSREDFTVVVIFLGVFLALEGHRRPGLVTAAVGAAFLVFDTQILQPHFAGGFVQASFLDAYGSSLGEIVRTMVSDPIAVLKDLMTEQNLAKVIALTGPLAFLPFLAPRFLLPVVPLEILYLLSSRPAAHGINNQYTVAVIPFVFVAVAMALSHRGREQPQSITLGTLVIAAVLFHSSIANTGLASEPWRWRARDDVDVARLAAARRVPRGAAVVASDRVRTFVARRRDVYTFPDPFRGYQPSNDPIDRAERQRRVSYVVVDTVDGTQWNPDTQRMLEEIVAERSFTKIFDDEGILVFRRSVT